MLIKLIDLGYPLDEVVFYDTGKEFEAIYRLRDKIQAMLFSKGIKYAELKPEMSFDYKMFDKPVCKRGTKEVHKHGYSWCGGTCRWGTTDKLASIDRYCNGAIDYVGIAADETKRLEKERKPNKRFPLAENWSMSEVDCLNYCYQSGVNWNEYTDSIYPDVPKQIDLYQILDRVSCWCCRNKNLKELKAIYYYFTNSYWRELRDIQKRLKEPMKQSGDIFELEERFKREIESEQNNLFSLLKRGGV
jgi:3'-phosphoadenosine 5'-phosphosulfate sulfotransferase (PAPS reductase)/FAD synthetase